MSDYISVRLLTELHPELLDLQPGEQTKMNHGDCPAGVDTKQRLFVKRERGKLMAYCHNCGTHGTLSLKDSRIRRGGENLLIENEKLHLPPDITFEPTEQPVEHIAWLHQYGIGRTLQLDYKIGWSNAFGRTILPVFGDGELLAYQRRRVLRHDMGEKYLTTRLKNIKHPVFKSYPQPDANFGPPFRPLVLVEDILSAIKVGMEFDSWALLGTYMPNTVVDEVVAAGYTDVVVWLDDDNKQVKRTQKSIRRRLSPYVDVYVMRRSDMGVRPEDKFDPKIFSPSEIRAGVDRRLAK